MTISFNCSECETLLRAPDTLAGKRCKCTKCSAVNVVPAPEDEGDNGISERPKAKKTPLTVATAAARIKKQAAVAEEDEEEATARPKKKASQSIATAPVKAKKKVALPADDEDSADHEPEAEEKPTRTRKGKKKKDKAAGGMNMPLVIGGVCALVFFGLLVVGGAIGGFVWYRSSNSSSSATADKSGGGQTAPKPVPKTDAYFYPNGTRTIVAVRPNDIANSQFTLSVDRALGSLAPQQSKDLPDQNYGVPVANIDRFIQATSMSSTPSIPIEIVRTRNPVTTTDIQALLKKQRQGLEFSDTKVGNFTLTQIKGPQPLTVGNTPAPTGYAVVDGSTVVYGPHDQLKSVLERDKELEISNNLKLVYGKADFSKAMVVVTDDLGSFTGNPLSAQTATSDKTKTEPTATDPLSVLYQYDYTADMMISATGIFKDAATAQSAKSEADAKLLQGSDAQEMAKIGMTVQTRLNGDTLLVDLKLDGAKYVAALKSVTGGDIAIGPGPGQFGGRGPGRMPGQGPVMPGRGPIQGPGQRPGGPIQPGGPVQPGGPRGPMPPRPGG